MQDYESQFRRARARQLGAQALGLAAVAVILLTIPQHGRLKAWLILIVVVAYLFFTVANWRCPKCRMMLPQEFAFFFSKCPRCSTGINPGGVF